MCGACSEEVVNELLAFSRADRRECGESGEDEGSTELLSGSCSFFDPQRQAILLVAGGKYALWIEETEST